jgi:uncharacterized membrane protein
MKRNRFREDVVIGAGLFILSSVAFLLIYMDLHKEYRGEHGLSPATFPLIAMGSIIILSAGLLASRLLKRKLLKKEVAVGEKLTGEQVKQVLAILLILLVYIHAINLVGYYTSTLAANVVLMLVLKVKSPFRLLASSAILIVCMFLFFEKGMMIALPRGYLL